MFSVVAFCFGIRAARFQDPPCTLNSGYMVPNSRYLGRNKG